jgi:hypothetical protein
MSHGLTLGKMFREVQLAGKLEKNAMLALVAIIKEMDGRLEKVERACKIRHPVEGVERGE